MVELPALERVGITFGGISRSAQSTRIHPVTLPNVQRMFLHSGRGVPDLLESLKLPSLTSLIVGGTRNLGRPFAILTVTPFSENLPNLAQLPEMEVTMGRQQNKVSFRSPSQATLDYHIEPRSLGWGPYRHRRNFWGGLPVDSIRKLTVDMGMTDGDEGWVVSLLGDMNSLEHLEFRSCRGHTPRYLHEMVMEGDSPPEMKTLTVYFGSGCEARQVHRLEDVAEGIGSGISVTWIKDSEVPGNER